MVTFFFGPSSAAGSELIDECVRRLDSPRQSFIYVVPTARRARVLLKQLLAARPQGFFRPHLLTFHSLMDHLYRRMGGAGVPISQSVKAILVEEVIADPRLGLAYFSRRGRPFPGLVSKLAAFISDLKQNLITPDEFERRISGIERPLAARSRELVLVYRQYQRVLAEYRLVDTDGMFWLVLEALEDPRRLREALGGIDLLIFDGFFDVTRAEGEVLQKLLARVDAWVRLDWLPGSPAHAAADTFVERFCSGAERRAVEPPAGAPAASLAGKLFRADQPASEAPGVAILNCRDRLGEVEAIAVEIKRMVVEGGFPPNRIAVALRNPQTCLPLVREVFGAAGIPFNCPLGGSLAESPVAAALTSLLAVVRENYSRESVLRLLRSPYVRFSFDFAGDGRGNSRSLDGDFLDTEARAARIFRGKDSWAQKLRQSIASLRIEAEADPGQAAARQERLARLEEQAAGVALALDELSKLARPMPPSEFGTTLTGLVSRFGIARGIHFIGEDAADEEMLERDYRALAAFQEVVRDLMFAAGFGRREFGFEEYAGMIEAGLRAESFGLRRDVDVGVQVLPVNELRGGDYDVVFLAGLVDGEFPLPEAPEIFYSKERRERLGFKTAPGNLEIERYLFAGAIAGPRRRLILSCPKSDGGVTLLRSLFAEELLRLAPGIRELEPPAGAAGGVASGRELQRCVGSALGADDPAEAGRALDLCRSVEGEPLRAMLRNLRAEARRRGGAAWSEFEGVLADPASRRAVAERFADRPFTPSKLEVYARCPFRFFVQEVLGLVELEEPLEEIAALERGSVLHHTLGRFYIERRARGRTELREDDDRDAAIRHIRSIAQQEFRRLPYEGLFYDVERERIAGGPARGARGVLEMFVDAEMGDRTRCKPRFFEVSFGFRRGDEVTDGALDLPELRISGNGGVRVVGRIDRIETPADSKLALVVDYKSGRTQNQHDIAAGISLQIPIYMLALRDAGFEPMGGAYYCLKDSPDDFGKHGSFFGCGTLLREYCDAGDQRVGMLDAQELDRFLAQTASRIARHAQAIRDGRFPPSLLEPADAGCQYCPFSGVCRRDIGKARRIAREVSGG